MSVIKMLCACVVLVACSGVSAVGCESSQGSANPPASINVDGTQAVADVNCDGFADTVSVGWRQHGSLDIAALRLAGASLQDSTDLRLEGLPRILAVADLNGDGTLDVLLALVTESTIVPQVVLLGSQGARAAAMATGLDFQALSFRFDDTAGQDCLGQATPRLRLTPGQQTVIEVVSGESWNDGCDNPLRLSLVVVGDTLRSAGKLD